MVATRFIAGRWPRQSSGIHKLSVVSFRLSDFAEHTSNFVDPVSTNYRGYDVWELPPNGQGIAVLADAQYARAV